MHAQDHAIFDAGALDRRADPPVRAHAVMPEGTADAAIRFLAEDSGAPLAWRPYRLRIGARLVLGRTDGDGFTTLFNGAERAQLTEWELA